MNKPFLNIDKTNVMLVGSSSRLRSVHDDEFTVMINGLTLESERQNASVL